MKLLRCVTALEHEALPIVDVGSFDTTNMSGDAAEAGITEAEAAQLMRLNESRPGFCERTANSVRLSQYCGVVKLQDRILEVLPKITTRSNRGPDEAAKARAVLLRMLSSASGITIHATESVAQSNVIAPLLDIFIEEFLECALLQARRGVLSRYVLHNEDLTVMRGRFEARGHIRRNFARPHLLHCEFDDFTPDNPYNRAVRAALNICRNWTSRASTQRLWWETQSRYSAITSVPTSAKDVAKLPRDRSTARYDALLKWCEWLLALASPSLSAGDHQAPGLLFDMNKLFEAHVAQLEEKGAAPNRLVVRHAPVFELARNGQSAVFPLKPDVTVWTVGPAHLRKAMERIVDAKWKLLDPQVVDWDVSQSDIYQMLAYAIRYGCDRIELVYPQPLDWNATAGLAPVFQIVAPKNEHANTIHIAVKLVALWEPYSKAG
jgi:5-methylcytosine-specific restriction enzyme subunit McrC